LKTLKKNFSQHKFKNYKKERLLFNKQEFCYNYFGDQSNSFGSLSN